MSEQQSDGAAGGRRRAAIEVEDPIALEAPERGSADELIDHGAAGELGPMRHSAAHVMAEAVLDLFPGTKLGIGPVIDDGFYYDFAAAPAADARRPARDRGADAREHRRRPPVRAAASCRRPRRRAFEVERDQPFKVEIIDDLLAAAERDGTPMPPTTFYRQGPFIDLCRGPHVASTGKIGPFKLLGTRRRVLARRREAPDAPAHLRHGLGDPGGARRYLWRREEAKKRDHRRLGVQLDLFSFHDVVAGLGLLAPQGPDDLAHPRGGDARAPGQARLPGGQHADPRVASGCGASRATGTCTRTTCSSSSPRTSCSASSR